MPDLSKEREIVMIPVAAAILRVLAAEENLYMGSSVQEELDTFYKKLFTEKIEPILRDANVKLSDLAFAFQLLQQPISNVKAITVDSMNAAFDSAVAKSFGLKDVSDIRVADIVRIQQLSTEEVAQTK